MELPCLGNFINWAEAFCIVPFIYKFICILLLFTVSLDSIENIELIKSCIFSVPLYVINPLFEFIEKLA